MTGDRRGAPRHSVPEDVSAQVAGVAARLLELSLVGAKVEHHDRFALASPQLVMTWRGDSASVEVRAARSEIVGRQDARLVYHTGLYFVDLNSITRGFISSILNAETLGLDVTGTRPIPQQPERSGERKSSPADDTWTRRVHLLKEELDDDFPYAQFRLTDTGWHKEYVPSAAQPEDGFTIPRDRYDFDQLQRTFEAADIETRRMMQIALESQLSKTT
jgi:hypothetical protein